LYLGFILALAGCGSDGPGAPVDPDPDPDPGPGQVGGDVVEVGLRNLAFNPSTVRIKAGQTVRWVNKESMLHTVTPDGHTEWSAATLSTAEATFAHAFDKAGTYTYYCQPHRSGGMTGTVVVE
jgi:plastocyanin